VYNVLDQQL